MPRGPVDTLPLVLIIILVAPALASPVCASSASTDPLKYSLAALASEPLGTAPVTLRREAYEALLPIAGMLPAGMVERIISDSELFADRARLTSAQPLEHDRELVKELLRLYRAPGTDPTAKDSAAQAASLLLRAGRHAALVALADGELVVNGPAGNAAKSLASQASAALKTAKIRYGDAMKALLRGDADAAMQHLAKSWEFSSRAMSLLGVPYSAEADRDGDGLLDIIEFRAGSLPGNELWDRTA